MTAHRRLPPNPTPAEFFQESYARYRRAAGVLGERRYLYRIADTVVCLSFAGDALSGRLTPALDHLRIQERDASPDLALHIWDSASAGVPMAPPPWQWGQVGDTGEIRGFEAAGVRCAFHWFDYSVNLLDHGAAAGIYWVPDPAAVPYWAQAAPLRTLLHWWMERNRAHILHAAAVGTEDGAVLLAGKGGIGKSTASLACLADGLWFLGDDCVVVRLEPRPVVYSLYCTAKLHRHDMDKFPSFAPLVHAPDEVGSDKPILVLHPQHGPHVARRLPLKAILLPRLADAPGTTIMPAPAWTVLRAIGFSAMSELELPQVGRDTLAFLDRLCAAVPGYVLQIGRAARDVSTALGGFLDRLRGSESDTQHSNRTPAPPPAPTVTAIVIAGGRRRIMKNAVRDSVESVLAQDYPRIEVIVVDADPTERTADTVARLPYEIRCCRCPNAATRDACLRGLGEASGAFVAFLTAGDVWSDAGLGRLAERLLRDPVLDGVQGRRQALRQHPETHEYEPAGDPEHGRDAFAAVFRRSALAKMGDAAGPFIAGERAGSLRIERIDDVTLLTRTAFEPPSAAPLLPADAARRLKDLVARRRAADAERT